MKTFRCHLKESNFLAKSVDTWVRQVRDVLEDDTPVAVKNEKLGVIASQVARKRITVELDDSFALGRTSTSGYFKTDTNHIVIKIPRDLKPYIGETLKTLVHEITHSTQDFLTTDVIKNEYSAENFRKPNGAEDDDGDIINIKKYISRIEQMPTINGFVTYLLSTDLIAHPNKVLQFVNVCLSQDGEMRDNMGVFQETEKILQELQIDVPYNGVQVFCCMFDFIYNGKRVPGYRNAAVTFALKLKEVWGKVATLVR